MQKVAHFLHFRLLPTMLRRWPGVVWHWPAVLLATLRVLGDPGTYRVAGSALRALGRPDTRLARWRFAWLVAYERETKILIGLQADRLTAQWASKYVICDGILPPGGAILIGPHQENIRFSPLVLVAQGHRMGLIMAGDADTEERRRAATDQDIAADDPLEALYSPLARLRERVFGAHIFYLRNATRPALRFLQQGGYLLIMPDPFGGHWPPAPRLGKAMPLAPGAVWLAKHADKPIVPMMLIPEGRRWRLWLGEPIAPTAAGVAAALEACLTRAPMCWPSEYWRAWHAAPDWTEPHDPPDDTPATASPQ